MFLDDYGTPREVTPENLHEYSYDLHGVMLLTSADHEMYIPPKWHGTIYSSAEILNNYRKRFNPDPEFLTFHALTLYEPEFICCKRCVVEITVLHAGKNVFTNTDIVVFLVKQDDVNSLITRELGDEINFFPINHHYHVRIMNEGIDTIYVDDRIYHDNGNHQQVSYHHQRIYRLLDQLRPLAVKSLLGRQLPNVLSGLCRQTDANIKNRDSATN